MPRCSSCDRKVSLARTLNPCRCGEHFCAAHHPPERHACPFDYKGFQQDELRKRLPAAEDLKRLRE